MTDKEIIIDGVNVAGCEFHSSTPSSELCYMKGNKCNDNPNCDHKQLARKTQECEKLREANDEKNEFLQKLGISATGEFHRIKHYIDKLHQECEELKRDNQILLERLTAYEEDADIQVALFSEVDRHKQALEKIEEILKYYANSTLGELQPNGTYRYLVNQSSINGEQYLTYDPRKAQEGLNIINEVKDE